MREKERSFQKAIPILTLCDLCHAHLLSLSAEGAYSDQTPELRNVTLTYCLKLANESDCNQTAVAVGSALPQDIKHRKLYPVMQCILMLMHNMFPSILFSSI